MRSSRKPADLRGQVVDAVRAIRPDQGEVGEDVSLVELGLDSLDRVALAVAVEQSTGLAIPDLVLATASLPKQIAGAGVILHDGPDRILLVRPSYRHDTWEIPGGGMEAGEYPWQTARREVKEELGLELAPGRLLAVDWVPPGSDGRPALANFLFEGGQLTQAQAEQHLRLDPHELCEWRLTTAQEWDDLLLPHMARRLRACADALATGTTAYLQHGWHPTNPDD